jgi:predicted NUDIX family NTP pyrophosphohydrolase
MPKQSAGLLLYRVKEKQVDVFLVHPGGPFWAKKDAGAWSIPKGEFAEGEDPLAAAQRELFEETGFTVSGSFASLGTVRQAGGKVIHGFAIEAEVDPQQIVSNSFKMEWPPRSGRWTEFPEVDRAAWFSLAEAKEKINRGQVELLDRFAAALKQAE